MSKRDTPVQDLRKGDKFTFLAVEQGSFYEALEDFRPGPMTVVFHNSTGGRFTVSRTFIDVCRVIERAPSPYHDAEGTPLKVGDMVTHPYGEKMYGKQCEIVGFKDHYMSGPAALVRSTGTHRSDDVHMPVSKITKVKTPANTSGRAR